MRYIFTAECLLRFATGEMRFIGNPDDPRILAAQRMTEASQAGRMATEEDLAALDGLPVIDAPSDYLERNEPKTEISLVF